MKTLRFFVGYFVTVIMSLLPITAFSWEYIEIENIYYYLDETTLTASIDAPMQYFGMGGEGDVVIPETVSYEGQTYIVNHIGPWAFSDNEDMTSITLPNTIDTIEFRAFFNCSSLTRIIIPKSVSLIEGEVFSGCI